MYSAKRQKLLSGLKEAFNNTLEAFQRDAKTV